MRSPVWPVAWPVVTRLVTGLVAGLISGPLLVVIVVVGVLHSAPLVFWGFVRGRVVAGCIAGGIIS